MLCCLVKKHDANLCHTLRVQSIHFCRLPYRRVSILELSCDRGCAPGVPPRSRGEGSKARCIYGTRFHCEFNSPYLVSALILLSTLWGFPLSLRVTIKDYRVLVTIDNRVHFPSSAIGLPSPRSFTGSSRASRPTSSGIESTLPSKPPQGATTRGPPTSSTWDGFCCSKSFFARIVYKAY